MSTSACRSLSALLLLAIVLLVPACKKKSAWSSYSVAQLELELPAQPQRLNIPLPETAHAFITDYETNQSVQGRVEITITRAAYKDTTTVSLEGAVQGSLREMKAVSGVTEFESTESNSKVGELEARQTKGSYRRGGQARAFEGLYFAREQTAWFVILDGPRDQLAETATRVFGSVVVGE